MGRMFVKISGELLFKIVMDGTGAAHRISNLPDDAQFDGVSVDHSNNEVLVWMKSDAWAHERPGPITVVYCENPVEG